MPAISHRLLARGALAHVHALHGERIEVITGEDAGAFFTGVIEVESDGMLPTELMADPRGRRMLRFKNGSVPRLKAHDRIKTDDGKTWTAIRQQFSAFLTTDFELREVVAGKDL